MVGRKIGMLLNAMLVKKKMDDISRAFGSVTVEVTSLNFRRSLELGIDEGDSLRSRKTATFFSRCVRYDAVAGESGMRCHAMTAMRTLGNPSRRNNNRQGAIGQYFPNFTIPHARELANEVESGAALKNIPVLKANSSLLKKKDR